MPIMKRVGKVANNEEGYILEMSLFVMMILILMGIALVVMGMQEYELSSRVKMMDQAYLIADAGINSAAVTLEPNPTFKDAVTPTYTAPYTSAIATNAGNSGGGTDFGGTGGKFTYWVYQSEQNSDSSYKVIKSKGTITSQGKTVERIIVARVVLGAGGQDYDASFDYLIYNGCSDDLNAGTWPKSRFGDWGYLSGQFTFDGSSTYNGHAPKGAVYTRGNVEIPVSLAGGVTYKGNIVATDNISLQNQWSVSGTWRGGGGIDVQGNAVAGIDGTGTATVSTTGSLGNAISMEGYLCAPQNVTVSTVGNINFSSAISLGGIVSGGSVSSTGTATVGGGLALGNIFSVGRTTIKSNFSGGVTYGNINTGKDASSPYIGLWAETAVAGGISGTNVYSSGQVRGLSTVNLLNMNLGSVYADDNTSTGGPGGTGIDFDTTMGNINCTRLQTTGKVDIYQRNAFYSGNGDIYAGTDAVGGVGGTGVKIDTTGVANITGNITSQGTIDVGTVGLGVQTGNWWSGNDIPFSFNGIGGNIGNLSADHDLTFSLGSVGYSVGKLWAGNDLRVTATQIIGGGSLGNMVATHNLIFHSSNGIGGSGVGNMTAGNDLFINASVGIGSTAIGMIEAGHDIARFNPDNPSEQAVIKTLVGGSSVGGMTAGSSLYMDFSNGIGTSHVNNGVMAGYAVRFDNNSGSNQVYIGYIPSSQISVLGGGLSTTTGRENISCGSTGASGFHCSGVTGCADWSKNPSNWNAPANYDQLATLYTDVSPFWRPTYVNGGWTGPGKPGIPATPNTVLQGTSYVGPGGAYAADLSTQLWQNPPTVDATTMLHAAGLSKQVNILTPNWAYFETLARGNDVANGPATEICPNPNCRRTIASTGGSWPNYTFPATCPTCHTSLAGVTPGPAHMVYENGPGDSDTNTSGIQLIWDNTTPYSSNEVVYNGDPNVTIYIKVLSFANPVTTPSDDTFTGTIVSQGPIVMDNNTSGLGIFTGQTLNLVSGKDITKSTSGWGLVAGDNANIHMWAAHDINVQNMRVSAVTISNLYGSFTAGNQVNFESNAFVDIANFKWSRWALDPLAWAPAFKVLDWKEI